MKDLSRTKKQSAPPKKVASMVPCSVIGATGALGSSFSLVAPPQLKFRASERIVANIQPGLDNPG